MNSAMRFPCNDISWIFLRVLCGSDALYRTFFFFWVLDYEFETMWNLVSSLRLRYRRWLTGGVEGLRTLTLQILKSGTTELKDRTFPVWVYYFAKGNYTKTGVLFRCPTAVVAAVCFLQRPIPGPMNTSVNGWECQWLTLAFRSVSWRHFRFLQ
jgi:hypothetical protein